MKPTRSKSVIMLEVLLKPWKRISEAMIVAVRDKWDSRCERLQVRAAVVSAEEQARTHW